MIFFNFNIISFNSKRRRSSNISQRIIKFYSNFNQHFSSNKISTAKYNLVTFFPKFLYEQFRKYNNIFFLIICLLQQIPNVSPTGRFTTLVPFLIILTVSAIKEIFEDIKRHKADHGINLTKTSVLNKHTKKFEKKSWEDVIVGDVVKCLNKDFFPSDLFLISSSEPNGLCYIETANLDGETNLKVRQSLNETYNLITSESVINYLNEAEIDYEQPNSNLYEFKGNLKINDYIYSISPNQILLRGAKLKNTKWIYGLVLYTGHESKLILNSMLQTPLKQSNVEKLTNSQMLFLFLILILIGLISTIFNIIWNYKNKHWYLMEFQNADSNFAFTFLTFFILYNNLIPISLQITLEIVRFIQAQFINWDNEMYCFESDSYAVARTSNLNEELGQVSYILSDKTGTLTRNVMEFRQCSIAGVIYNENEYKKIIQDLQSKSKNYLYIKDFLTLMSVCHTVVPERIDLTNDETSIDLTNNQNEQIENDELKKIKIKYQAASPDETALVKAASKFGYVFTVRTPKFVYINALDKEEKYEILNVFEFTSERKRMSVVVRCPDNSIKIYIKGADSIIYERLIQNEFTEINLQHLERFASFGLRTLCLAYAEIPEKVYERWFKEYQKALESDLTIRQEYLNKLIAKLERNLTLLGSTAIEDKLQDGVPQAIETLHQAGIKLWILTGDKQETAINIGYSCKLLKHGFPIYIINEVNLVSVNQTLKKYLNSFDSEGSLIIDGHSLKFALNEICKNDFLKIALNCKSVICCRVSPIQKADIVNLIKNHNFKKKINKITLAIGDGANDVAMIRAAHVGIGISGKEGLQAAYSADYSISQFRFLVRLLLVHGSWSLTRLCKLILYSFYKNIALYVIELWFAILSGWSGQTIFERWTIGLYNVLFTMAPPLAIGIFERQCSAETMIKYPKLYQQHFNYFNIKIFWIWVFGAILHSLFLFWLTYFAVQNDTLWSNGLSDGGYLMFGNMLYTYIIITVCLKAGLEISSWTIFTYLTIWGSIIVWLLFIIIYSKFWPSIPFAAEMAGINDLLYSSAVFWFGLFIIPFTTLLPDLIYIVIKKTCFKTLTDKIIEEVAFNGCQQTIFSETARLIRSMCDINIIKSNRNENLNLGESLGVREDHDLQHGYAFSQEENGVISQAQLIRSYDTTKNKPLGN